MLTNQRLISLISLDPLASDGKMLFPFVMEMDGNKSHDLTEKDRRKEGRGR